MKRFVICAMMLHCVIMPSAGQKWADYVVPASLIAVGSYGIESNWFHSLNNRIKDGMTTIRGSNYLHVDNYIQYVPATAALFAEYTGADAKHNTKERLALITTSAVITASAVNITKHAVGEKRPDTQAKTSFPSGHTATAFMGAELVRKEYGGLWAVGAYSLAAAVGVLRMYNQRHWFNDVLTGAGIGIISVELAYLLLPMETRLLHLQECKKTSLLIIPAYNYSEKAFSFNLSLTF